MSFWATLQLHHDRHLQNIMLFSEVKQAAADKVASLLDNLKPKQKPQSN